MSQLDKLCGEKAKEYYALACEFLKEAIRIPADYVDDKDVMCGLSNHERPRLDYLTEMIIKHKCVEKAEDVGYDEFGNLVWSVSDPNDGVAPEDKKVVWFDGHSDTVMALRSQWHEDIGEGLDPYNGLTDINKVNITALKRSMGWMLEPEEFEHAIFGRGAADQLAGVVSQMIGTKIMLELRSEGALKGVVIKSIATVAEEDNDGGGAMYYSRKVWPTMKKEELPDCIVMTEGTGDSTNGAVAIYRGQRGRMQVEVDIIGVSCHGSMPHEGLNPLEFGAAILVECTEQVKKGEGLKDDEFLGKGTRTASWAKLDTPSDCAVPSRFTFRFDRRITVGEDPTECVKIVDALPSVKVARDAGLTVNVHIPKYEIPTHTGYVPGNDAVYMSWSTPEEHESIKAAVESYKGSVTPFIREDLVEERGRMRRQPRVDKWIFSTDGVGYPVKKEDLEVPASKNWVVDEESGFTYPAMLGVGAGLEHHCHKIGEYIDARHLMHACAFMARFPSKFAGVQ